MGFLGLGYTRIGKYVEGDREITFYHKQPRQSLFFRNYKKSFEGLHPAFQDVIKKVLASDAMRRMRKVEIYFSLKDRRSFKKGLFEGMQEAAYDKTGPAHVLPIEMMNGENRIYLYEDLIGIKAIAKTGALEVLSGHQAVGEAQKEQMFADASEEIVRQTMSSIIHEITHLWHLRVSKAQELTQKNLGRFHRASEKLFLGDIDTSGAQAFRTCWKEAREELLFLLEFIVQEGLATYAGNLEAGRVTCERRSVFLDHEEKRSIAGDLNGKILRSYELLQHMIAEQNPEHYVSAFRRLNENNRKFGYELGAHIYHTIFFVFDGELSMDDIAPTNYSILLKLYEHACGKLGLRPLIGLDSDAVFCLRAHIRTLHDLRKGKPVKLWKS